MVEYRRLIGQLLVPLVVGAGWVATVFVGWDVPLWESHTWDLIARYVAVKHHVVEQVGDHAGVVGDDQQPVADRRARALATAEVDDTMLFGQAGDDGVGIADHQSVIGKAEQIGGQRLGAGIDDGAILVRT